MKRGAMCLLVFGLTNILNAAELGLEGVSTSELKEIEEEIAKGNVPPNFTPSDKPKRGAAKLTNTDNPSFNHLSSSTSAKTSAAAAAAAAAATASQAPLRYVYNNQYYPTNPYLSYLQPQQHAAQIAAQYAFQPPGVTHYLQTPTQIQYVSSPSALASSVPSTGRYQSSINSKVSSISSSSYPTTGSVPNTAASATQYVSAPQQLLLTSPQSFAIPQTYVSPSSLNQPSTSPSTQTSSASSAMTAYPQTQQYYYPQQPIVMLLVQPQPQPMALVYPNGQQSSQMAYLLGQHPLLNLYGGHRFGYPFAPQANQVTYLVPMAVTNPQQTTGTTSSATTTGSNDKQTISAQETSGSTSFGLRTTKA